MYRLTLSGYGSELRVGTLPKKVCTYFFTKKLDMITYSTNKENLLNVPEEYQPFPPGEFEQASNFVRALGIELSEHCTLLVENEGVEILRTGMDPKQLQESNVDHWCFRSIYEDSYSHGVSIFVSHIIQQGTFFVADIDTEEFDSSKLKLIYQNIEDAFILEEIHYDGKKLESIEKQVQELDKNFYLRGEQ